MQPSGDRVFPEARGGQGGRLGLTISVLVRDGGLNIKDAKVEDVSLTQPSCDKVFPGA